MIEKWISPTTFWLYRPPSASEKLGSHTEMKNLVILLFLCCIFSFPSIHADEIQGIVKNSEGVLENAVVYIEKIDGKTFRPPEAPVVLHQIGLVFTPHVLPVLVGTTVNFPNEDVVLHNVFSPGYTGKFNLGTYPQGSTKTKVFDKPGVVLLLCNVHHEMSAFVIVVETPYFVVTDQDGKYTLKNVPPGIYNLVVWHEKMRQQIKEIEILDQGPENINFLMTKK